jgi:predicted transport protein
MKTAKDVEKEFLEGLEENYGQSLKVWMDAIKHTGITKQIDILNWLRKEKQFKHMDAWLLSGIYMNGGKPVYGDESDLLENQMAKYQNMKPLFEFVSDRILKAVPGSEREIKKTYVSFKKKREFAAVNIKKDEIRLGMDLGDMPFNNKVEKVRMTGPMPRISHMVVVKDREDFTDEVADLLKKSDQRVNN